MKTFLHTIFYNQRSRAFVVVNDFFAVLTLVSIAGVVLETVPSLAMDASWARGFRIVEWVTVGFFTLEYVARFVAAPRKLAYVTSFFGIVDLLAIVPTYFGLANFTFLKSVRILRIMRFLRMLRMVKVVRASAADTGKDAHRDPEHAAHSEHGMSVRIYFATLFSAVLLSATALWFVESAQSVAANIPVAMLWSAKVLLGGASQAQPVTAAGEIVIIITRFAGLALFGLLINVIGVSLKRLLFGSEKA